MHIKKTKKHSYQGHNSVTKFRHTHEFLFNTTYLAPFPLPRFILNLFDCHIVNFWSSQHCFQSDSPRSMPIACKIVAFMFLSNDSLAGISSTILQKIRLLLYLLCDSPTMNFTFRLSYNNEDVGRHCS